MAEAEEEHIVSPAFYVAVLVALMILLAATLVTAFVDLDKLIAGENHRGTGYWNMSVALLIAVLKAILIILFFMHVKYGSRLTWAFAAAGFVWLGILLTLSMSDYLSRNYPPSTPKSPPIASPDLMRPPPRHDSVVPGASAVPTGPSYLGRDPLRPAAHG